MFHKIQEHGIFVIMSIMLAIFMTIDPHQYSALAEQNTEQKQTVCDIHQTPCTKNLAAGAVTLEINPRPIKAMTDLTFTATFTGVNVATPPYIDLGMPGMNMGPNQVKLKSTAENRYEGTGIIVRCPSGRRTWKAALTVPDAGTAEFIFDVID